jgi:hypothetical protein
MDRRLYPATDRIAHRSLGRADLPATDGQVVRVTAGLADLLRSPNDARERQLPFGTAFCVIDRDQGHAFGFAVQDGYCGWLNEMALGDLPAATHWVKTTGTHLYPEPRVQSREIMPLPMGAQICVSAQNGGFAETPSGFVPLPHLSPKGQYLTDPAGVAEQFLGTPYLWGGNSRAGLDCSGLVQMSLRACGIDAPADSDLQQDLGSDVSDDLQRNDLIFWRGHVAIVVDADRLIHANGDTMSVAYEGISDCIARIDTPVTHRRRIT